jgi:hypothetical protein
MRTSRRDYYEIVKLIRRLEKGTVKRLMWAHAFAKILKRSNAAFNEDRFVQACGADDDPSNVVNFADRMLDK